MTIERFRQFYTEMMDMKGRKFQELWEETSEKEEKLFLLELWNVVLEIKTRKYLGEMGNEKV